MTTWDVALLMVAAVWTAIVVVAACGRRRGTRRNVDAHPTQLRARQLEHITRTDRIR